MLTAYYYVVDRSRQPTSEDSSAGCGRARDAQRRLVEVSQARGFEVLLDPIKSNVNKLGDQCCVRVPAFDRCANTQ